MHHGFEKLCNHPKLIFDAIREKKYAGKTDGGNAIDDNLTPYFHGLYDGGGWEEAVERAGRCAKGGNGTAENSPF